MPNDSRLEVPELVRFAGRDGYRFAVRRWPVDEPRANVVCLHGIVSHGGWYLGSGRALARAGCSVHFIDRRGSGLNLQCRGDVPSWETWLDDVESYLAALPRETPRVLLGISWGGKLATAIARRAGPSIDGLVLACPGLHARQQPGVLKRAAVGIANSLPLRSVRAPIPLRDPALFTDQPQAQRLIREDPLALWSVTMRFAYEDLKLTRYALAAGSTLCTPTLCTPTLLILAGRDRIVDNARTRRYFSRIGSEQKRLVEIADAAHTVEFHSDPAPYWRALSDWITARGEAKERTRPATEVGD